MVNELYYTYRQLHRLLPKFIRVSRKAADVGGLLLDQDEEVQALAVRLREVGADHGVSPKPCVCPEANRLLAEVNMAGYAFASRRASASDLLPPIQALHSFLIRMWNALLDTLRKDGHKPTEKEERFFDEAAIMQRGEARLHRALTALYGELQR